MTIELELEQKLQQTINRLNKLESDRRKLASLYNKPKKRWHKPAPKTPLEALRFFYECELANLNAAERVNGINVTKERSAIENKLAKLGN